MGFWNAPKAPRLKAIAELINKDHPELSARIVEGYCNTDTKIPGTRFISKGKGRKGNRLIVTEIATSQVVCDHNAAETYRCNYEVMEWLKRWDAWKKGGKKPSEKPIK